jgi:hypothetical protein
MTDSPPEPTIRHYPLARVMFWLAFLDLLLIAGIVHRANHPTALRTELAIMYFGHFALWPIIFLETWIAFAIRDRALRPRVPTIVRSLLITIAPPMRMGMPCPFTGMIWIPRLGWCERGKILEDRLERAFHKPMLVFALLILPALIFEFMRAEEVKSNQWLALALHVSVGIIWVAFATEFIIKVSAVRRPFKYCRERWIDLAIVILPMLESVLTAWAGAAPLARLLRVSQAVAPEQLARMGQVYRLRGLLVKGWRAVLVLRVVAKLTGYTEEKQLRRLQSDIAEAEAALAILKAQAEDLRKKLDAGTASETQESPAIGN